MQDVVQQVTAGLSDLSVSRPVERLSWGIPVPDDPSQTIYVWLDALINYLTKANYPFQIPGQEHAAGWPADLHVIGKDIVRFHCIYWPAFLLALDLPLPKQIMTHAHWTLGREKMSKSTGNVVNPFFALDRFGSDTMRYYLVRDGGVKDDSDYDNEYIIDRYRVLQNTFGNLVTRVVRGKGWNVRRAVESGQVDESARGQQHLQYLNNISSTVDHWMAQLQPGEALKSVLELVNQVRRAMDYPILHIMVALTYPIYPFFPYPQSHESVFQPSPTNTPANHHPSPPPDKPLHAILIPLDLGRPHRRTRHT